MKPVFNIKLILFSPLNLNNPISNLSSIITPHTSETTGINRVSLNLILFPQKMLILITFLPTLVFISEILSKSLVLGKHTAKQSIQINE